MKVRVCCGISQLEIRNFVCCISVGRGALLTLGIAADVGRPPGVRARVGRDGRGAGVGL